jgi:hypothetical protein
MDPVLFWTAIAVVLLVVVRHGRDKPLPPMQPNNRPEIGSGVPGERKSY